MCSVSDFLLVLGKLVIVLVCGIVSYLSFGGYIPEIKVFIRIHLPDPVLEEPEAMWGSGHPDPVLEEPKAVWGSGLLDPLLEEPKAMWGSRIPDPVLEKPEETWGSRLPDPQVGDSVSRILSLRSRNSGSIIREVLFHSRHM